MAPNQKRSKPGWILSCFGFGRKPTPSEGYKGKKPVGRRKFWRKRVSLDEKATALKATQSIMFETSKVEHQLKLHHKTALIIPQYQLNVVEKKIDNKVQPFHSDNPNPIPEDSYNDNMCDKHIRKPKSKPTTFSNASNNATKESLIGISIMLTTLLIMGVCGKLCAILCMSAWFYCLPFVSAAKNANEARMMEIIDTKTNLDREKLSQYISVA